MQNPCNLTQIGKQHTVEVVVGTPASKVVVLVGGGSGAGGRRGKSAHGGNETLL